MPPKSFLFIIIIIILIITLIIIIVAVDKNDLSNLIARCTLRKSRLFQGYPARRVTQDG